MTPEYIKTLLKLTKVSSEATVAATIAHLCHGKTQPEDKIVAEAIAEKGKNNS